jgi:hypothetical protein
LIKLSVKHSSAAFKDSVARDISMWKIV